MCTVLPAYLILTTVDTTPIFFRETGKKIFYVSDADVSAVPGTAKILDEFSLLIYWDFQPPSFPLVFPSLAIPVEIYRV